MAVNERWLSSRAAHFALYFCIAIFVLFRYGLESVQAARVSDIRGTKHNLSAAADSAAYTHPTAGAGSVPVRNIKATTETQICVFCHTPHGGSNSTTPLWNRKVAGGSGYSQNYVMYDSSTLDAKQVQNTMNQPGGSSKLCLSCHDGTVAIGNVNVLNGLDKSGQAKTNSTITMTGGPTMPTGAGTDTGFTRYLGTDLTNDHPISISYNDTLAGRDGELRKPSLNTTLVGLRTPGIKPKLKLESTGEAGENLAQVQCATCHDPHIRETDTTVGNQKFLRLNRFQHKDPPSDGTFDTTENTGDIICLACHDKGGKSWAYSAHANSAVADEMYSTTHADRREFPRNLQVWKAACLNCHDTHAVAGTRRLLREGTNEGTSTAAAPKAGGVDKAAQEETCYQCHDGGGNGTLQSYSEVPNIKSDFTTKAIRMPITTGAQGTSGGGGGNTSEVHDISSSFSDGIMNCATAGTQCGKDLLEPRSKLGQGGGANLKNRHAECTDCHNPHRVIRGSRGLPGGLSAANTSTESRINGASAGHHYHEDKTGYTHTNVISGVLRGTWGVEPSYGSASFFALPTGYAVKRGDPVDANISDCGGANKATCDAATVTYVTREYQICMKCHSDYGYNDNNVYPSDTANGRPSLGGTNLTAKDISRVATSYTTYTNQAREFQAPSGHRARPASTTDSGAAAAYGTNNHRSWHPVMDSTGRTGALRGGSSVSNNWRTPWSNAVGSQTMYCTDCHGSGTAATTVIPTTTSPWGPHGSDNNFLLKGAWTTSTGSGNTNDLCFRCHLPGPYADADGSRTGFYIGPRGNGRSKNNDGHTVHRNKIGSMRCNWCHIAVPHGWKNKALLVNLFDVGPEAGQTAGTTVNVESNGTGYSNGPYYRNAKLKVRSFAVSGDWWIGDCGVTPYNSKSGEDGSREWMLGACKSPP